MDFSVSFLENLYESESVGNDAAVESVIVSIPSKSAHPSPRKASPSVVDRASIPCRTSLGMTPSPMKRKRTPSMTNSPSSAVELTDEGSESSFTRRRRSPRKHATSPVKHFAVGATPPSRHSPHSNVTCAKAGPLDLSSIAEQPHPPTPPETRDEDSTATLLSLASPTHATNSSNTTIATPLFLAATAPSSDHPKSPTLTSTAPSSPAATDAAAPLSTDPSMDQIFMTGQQVHCVRHVVLSQRRYASGWTGHDGAIDDVRRVLERTISFGESQSAMVVGSAGSGKRAIVARAVAQLKAASPRVFFPVYLSGSALANDMEGFREIVQQLVPEGGVAGHKAASFFNVYDFLKQLLLEKALAGHAVIFVLDAFDTFVGGAKQLLVYNLLDWMQSKDVCIGLVGISCNFNVLAHFEKRVKSRFSNIQIAVPRPPLKAILQLLWSSFQFRRPAATIACDPTNAPRPIHATGHSVAWPAHVPQPSDDFYDLWEASLYRVLFGADLHSTWWWQHLYDLGKPVDVFVRLLQVALTQLTPSKPLLDNAHVQAAWDVLFPDHVLHALRGDDSVLWWHVAQKMGCRLDHARDDAGARHDWARTAGQVAVLV
ncbi:hypothetical protein, variant 2 [Aphanomyces invadans]|uniref:Origin recognition complex subunit 4 C-terminal domain-containing protein n=1 Tax=Aphanomyces invadans TaxID=157072 RepID=A0A024TQH1_9STRA|nr:hypothetical protein, variant 2 [Aphanomyces invadans]ETV95861.1 hypothetical protein, variant 2 [Aphanomyces invadans]|eukprot:XP_008875610.1 hypothetical protein, variant 2 [Aphanomyces invadans]